MNASLRASDDDRERVAATLGRHFSEGRLDVSEYEERVGQAYAARTLGELAPLTADLPGPGPFDVRQPGTGDLERSPRDYRIERRSRREARAARRYGQVEFRGLLLAALICVAIWAASWVSRGGGPAPEFWPIWVIAPCLAIAVIRRFSR